MRTTLIPMSAPHRRAVTAFTLIELLVVISIIALMVALLLPALRMARMSVHVTVSLSQIRQVTLALNAYASDNLSSLPYSRFWLAGQTLTSPQGQYWGNKLLTGGYVGDPRIYWSPGREIHGLSMQTISSTPTTSLLTHTGYAANTSGAMPHEVLVSGVGTTAPMRVGFGIQPPPARHVIFSEQYRDVGTLLQDGRDGWYAGFGWSGITSQKAFCYNGALVRSYMDGHASAGDGIDIDWLYADDRNGAWVGDGIGEPWYDMAGDDFN